ncbi:MAG: NUDIX domain-containing protein [Acholeplasmatales bacterium]|nr:NUDIX domain-containing protein [Acholeplasmatales bacterium]
MRLLLDLDAKDYTDSDNSFMIRKAARAIILKNGKISMAHSSVYDFFKFPGGGVKRDETIEEALIREVKEETGLIVKPESIKEYGYVLEKYKMKDLPNSIYTQYSYYYFCDVEDEIKEQHLDEYENDYGFELSVTSVEEAYLRNKYYNEHSGMLRYIKREELVLELLKNEKK